MNKQSVTITSLAVLLLGWLAKGADLPAETFTEMQVEGLINSVGFVMQVVGAVGIYWGRYRQGDVNIFGRKK